MTATKIETIEARLVAIYGHAERWVHFQADAWASYTQDWQWDDEASAIASPLQFRGTDEQRTALLTLLAWVRAGMPAVAEAVEEVAAATYTISPAIKDELATAFAATQHIAYVAEIRGDWYAVDTDGDGVLDAVMHAEHTRQWNPWSDNAVAIPAAECFDHDSADYAWGEEEEDDQDTTASWARDNMLDVVEYDPEVEV